MSSKKDYGIDSERIKSIKKMKIIRVKGGFTFNDFLEHIKENPSLADTLVLKTKKECRKVIKNLLKHRYVDD